MRKCKREFSSTDKDRVREGELLDNRSASMPAPPTSSSGIWSLDQHLGDLCGNKLTSCQQGHFNDWLRMTWHQEGGAARHCNSSRFSGCSTEIILFVAPNVSHILCVDCSPSCCSFVAPANSIQLSLFGSFVAMSCSCSRTARFVFLLLVVLSSRA